MLLSHDAAPAPPNASPDPASVRFRIRVPTPISPHPKAISLKERMGNAMRRAAALLPAERERGRDRRRGAERERGADASRYGDASTSEAPVVAADSEEDDMFEEVCSSSHDMFEEVCSSSIGGCAFAVSSRGRHERSRRAQ